MRHNIFIGTVALLFVGMTILFLFFPRSTFSEMERRELKTFPAFTADSLKSGDFTTAVSEWFSDSGPYRDKFMTAHLMLKEWFGWRSNDPNAITIHEDNSQQNVEALPGDDGHIDPFEVQNGADAKAKIASRGIIVVGAAPNARALMIYGGVGGGDAFAAAANKYKAAFGDKVNVYAMVIPNSTEYYIPEQVKSKSKSMYTTIVSIHDKLRGVKPVDVYTVLGQHAGEDIFLRTDHHWAPLGAYYAARQFAQVAGVPFRDLNSYERRVVRNFVGTMYGYSNDIAIKNSPEDFVYYVPTGVDYSTTYINFTIDKDYNVTSESRPVKGEFFVKFHDGSGAAYSTFMGGDTKITKVDTGTKNGRRLMIIKDSFGNALPGYLFYSFEQIHVIDSRYFTKSMRDYVRENCITDILLALNVFRAYTPSVGKALENMLDGKVVRKTSSPAPAKEKPKTEVKEKPKAEPKKSDAAPAATPANAAPEKSEAAPVEQPQAKEGE